MMFSLLHTQLDPGLPALPCTTENVRVSCMINEAGNLLFHTGASLTNASSLAELLIPH